jgi:hypothetical protein
MKLMPLPLAFSWSNRSRFSALDAIEPVLVPKMRMEYYQVYRTYPGTDVTMTSAPTFFLRILRTLDQ